MRKLTFTITTLSIILSSLTLRAQLDEFDLSDFELPDIKRHQLDIGTNLGSRIKNSNQISDDTETKIFSSSANLHLRYKFYRNSKKYQGDQYARFNGSFSSANYDNEYKYVTPYTNERAYNILSGDLYLISNNRFYFKGLSFFELDMDVNLRSDRRENEFKEYMGTGTDYQTDTYNDNSTLIQFELPVYFGYGRIERVEDARQAVFILNDLQRFGRLTRVPNTAEVIAFSERIAEVKNKRFFDSRLQKIDELEVADTYLQSAGLVEGSDIAYFTSLNDMWDYGALQVRLAGYRVYGGAIPAYGIYDSYNLEEIHFDSKATSQQTKAEYENDNRIQKLLFCVGFEYQKPIKQKWQYSLQTSIRIGPSKSTNKYTNLSANEPTVESTLKLTDYIGFIETGFGFYPNTRTYLTLNLTGFYNYDKGTYTNDSYEQEAENTFYNLAADIGAYYYISPKLRLYGQYSYGYNNLNGTNTLLFKYDPVNYFNYLPFNWNISEGSNVYKTNLHNFRVTLTYSIF